MQRCAAAILRAKGLDHSGSFRFADHIYRGQPSGRGAFGHWLDARLLALPAVRSFRNRFHASRDELTAFLRERAGQAGSSRHPQCPVRHPARAGRWPPAFVASGSTIRAALEFHGLDLDQHGARRGRRFRSRSEIWRLSSHGRAMCSIAASIRQASTSSLPQAWRSFWTMSGCRSSTRLLRVSASRRCAGDQRDARPAALRLSAAVCRDPRPLPDGRRSRTPRPPASVLRVETRVDDLGLQSILVAQR